MNLKCLAAAVFCLAAPAAASTSTLTTAAYPLIMYAPEYSLMLGGGAVFVARRGCAAADTRPDNVTVNALYTLKNQAVLQLLPEFYSKDETLKFRTTVLYQDMPTSFFGVGNSGLMNSASITAREEKYTNRTFIFQPQLTRTIWGRFRAGLSYDLKSTSVLKIPPGGSLASGSVPGTAGGELSGLGLMLDYDTRDNLFFPSHGAYAQATARFYRKTFGSDYTYDYYAADLRGYRRLGGGGVMALQFAAVIAGQGVPFYDMPLYDLRGIYNTYFTNRSSYYAQAEYR